tara:strand:+ start:1843 stop:2187 length:345 start_codon:yes stop_codon:yes gene_type:complete
MSEIIFNKKLISILNPQNELFWTKSHALEFLYYLYISSHGEAWMNDNQNVVCLHFYRDISNNDDKSHLYLEKGYTKKFSHKSVFFSREKLDRSYAVERWLLARESGYDFCKAQW